MRVSQSHEKIWWKCSHADFTRVWDPLTCWLSKGVLKQCFLESNLTKSFTVCKFRNKVAMMIIFFFQIVSHLIKIAEMEQKNPKKFLVFKIISFEWGSTNCLNLEKDTCHWQSMCYETSLSFKISETRLFSSQVLSQWWENMMKVLSFTFYKGLGPSNMCTLKGCSERVFFKE